MTDYKIQQTEQQRINNRHAVRESLPLYCYPPKDTGNRLERGLELLGCFLVIIGVPVAFAFLTLVGGV